MHDVHPAPPLHGAPDTSSTALSAVAAIAPELARAAADEPDRLGADVLALLDDTGSTRMLLPARYGGLELSWPQTLAVVQALAVIDGSLGWRVGQVAQAHNVVSCFPTAAQDSVLGAPGNRLAGSVAPKGRASARDGALKVTGQWPFVTGAPAADWFYLNCLEMDGRSIAVDEQGRPLTRLVLVPAARAEVLDTWHVLGLRGTESCDVAVSGVEIDAALSFALDPADPRSGEVLDTIARSGLIVAATTLGIARGAFDDLLALVRGGRRPTFSRSKLGDSPVFRREVGELAVTLRAASALLADLTGDGAGGVAQRAELRAATSRVAESALQVTEACYRAAGGPVVYDGAPLQRRLRDGYTAAQHVVAGTSFYEPLGALLTGADAEGTF